MTTLSTSPIGLWLLTGRMDGRIDRPARGYTPDGRPVQDADAPAFIDVAAARRREPQSNRRLDVTV